LPFFALAYLTPSQASPPQIPRILLSPSLRQFFVIYLFAVVECLAAEVLELARNTARRLLGPLRSTCKERPTAEQVARGAEESSTDCICIFLSLFNIMTPKIDFIDEINPFKEIWKIKVKVTTVWNTSKFNNPEEVFSIDFILIDEKGGKIQATMKKSLFNKFSCQLKEDSSYVITNFGVGENIGSYKPTQHAFRINFLYSTSVRECHDMLMPTTSFDFIAFEDITSNRIDVTYLVDVIGELTGIGNIEEWENNGNKTKRLTFELED
ncbi:hypothetical protein Taro_011183, partial [Colocasia esculenta]|nr:hypothetical protein [Colocasia esculenta]